MTARESTLRAFAWFSSAYPSSRKVDESTVEMWTEFCADLDPTAIEQAARAWIRSEPRYPSLAAFLELVRAQRSDRGPVERDFCGACEDGWIETIGDGRGTVTRCPNGCLPPPMGQIGDALTESSAHPSVIAALRATQDAAAARRREVGDRAYLEERGYDPDRYRISDGMVMANPPAPIHQAGKRAGSRPRVRS